MYGIPASVSTTGRAYDSLSGFDALAAAIVYRACEDHLLARRNGGGRIEKGIVMSLNGIEEFFRSDWFRVLCDVDGELLIRGLRRMDPKRKSTCSGLFIK